jgi:Ran GTPase-activating protein (RanGAP) involved in mRNA processing and transport
MLNDLPAAQLALVCSYLGDGVTIGATAVAKQLFVHFVKALSVEYPESCHYASESNVGRCIAGVLIRLRGNVESLSIGARAKEDSHGSIRLRNKDITAFMEGVRATKANGATLRVLHLEANGIGHHGGAAMASFDWALLGPTLHQLFLVKQELGDDGASHLAAGIPILEQLKVLNLSGNIITEKGAVALSNGFAAGTGIITDLCLFGNPILPEGGAAICTAIANKLSELRNLNLGCCKLGPVGVADVAAAMVVCPHFRGLDLTQNHFGDQGALVLGESLCECMELEQLWLSENDIGHEGMTHLVRLGLPPRLQVFDFSNAALDLNASALLAAGMHGALQEIYLFDVCLGDLQLGSLCEGFQQCGKLRHLDLSENEISDEGLHCLSCTIAKSLPLLEVLDLRDNRASYLGAQELMDRILPTCPKLTLVDLKWALGVDGPTDTKAELDDVKDRSEAGAKMLEAYEAVLRY